MRRKIVEWLRKRGGGGERGADSRLREELRVTDTGFPSKLLNGKRDGNVRIDTLDSWAEALGIHTWALVYMIEFGIARESDLSPQIQRMAQRDRLPERKQVRAH